MEKKSIQGFAVPCITPFHPDGEVNLPALENYLDFLAQHVPIISVCAIYGSGILMRPEQRELVARTAVEVAGDRTAISVFVGAADTDTAVRLARHAGSIGAVAVSCVAPFYYKQVDEAIFQHFAAIVRSAEIPVYAYDSPIFAGNLLSMNVLARLSQAGLAGVITGAATYGIEHLWMIMRAIKTAGFSVWSIRDGLALPAMMMGARGFETGVGNFFPELVKEFYHAIQNKDYDQAGVLQNRMLSLRDISHALGRNIPTLHALIRMRGPETGVPRLPFLPLSEVDTASLRRQLAALDFPVPFQ